MHAATGPQGDCGGFSIERLLRGHPGFETAVQLVLTGTSGPSPSGSQACRRVYELDGGPRHRVHVVAARDGQQVLTAALAVESAGQAALVYLPPGHLDDTARTALGAVLDCLIALARERQLALLQALVSPADHVRARILRRAGFRHLAELIYLQRDVAAPPPESNTPAVLEWRTYQPRDRARFVEALSESYRDSLDCPGLSGLRAPGEALEGHRATGSYDPAGWFLATCENRIAGVILTSSVPERSAIEIVYMGVSPTFRGQGVGSALLDRAVARACTLQVDHVTCAVDAINEPARRLYARWGFQEMDRRRAWITALTAADGIA